VEEPTPILVPTALAQFSDGFYLAVGGAASEEFSSTGLLQSIVTPETIVASNPSSPASEAIFASPTATLSRPRLWATASRRLPANCFVSAKLQFLILLSLPRSSPSADKSRISQRQSLSNRTGKSWSEAAMVWHDSIPTA